MKKYLQDKCDEVLKNLRNMVNKNESQVMDFEQSAEEDCKEAELLIAKMRRIEQAERDYQEEFAPDGIGWKEV